MKLRSRRIDPGLDLRQELMLNMRLATVNHMQQLALQEECPASRSCLLVYQTVDGVAIISPRALPEAGDVALLR